MIKKKRKRVLVNKVVVDGNGTWSVGPSPTNAQVAIDARTHVTTAGFSAGNFPFRVGSLTTSYSWKHAVTVFNEHKSGGKLGLSSESSHLGCLAVSANSGPRWELTSQTWAILRPQPLRLKKKKKKCNATLCFLERRYVSYAISSLRLAIHASHKLYLIKHNIVRNNTCNSDISCIL